MSMCVYIFVLCTLCFAYFNFCTYVMYSELVFAGFLIPVAFAHIRSGNLLCSAYVKIYTDCMGTLAKLFSQYFDYG